MEKQQAGWGVHPVAGSQCQTGGFLLPLCQPGGDLGRPLVFRMRRERPRKTVAHPCGDLSGLCVLPLAGGSVAGWRVPQQLLWSLAARMS